MIALRRSSMITAGTAFLLAALATAVTVRFAPRGADAGFLDLGHDGYQLREVLDLLSGGRVFRDTFDQYGPLAPLFNVIGFVAFGRTLLAIKYAIALWYGATAVALYVVARYFLDRGLSVFSVLAWIALAPFYQQGVMISPHAYASLMQTLAMLAVLAYVRTERLGYLLAAGALCAVTGLLKESIGALLLASLVLFIAVMMATGEKGFRRGSRPLLALLGSFACVMAAAAMVLLLRGSLHDWYLQTIAFPRSFYLGDYGDAGDSGMLRSAWRLAAGFVQLQATAEPVWAILRGVVIAGAVAAVVRRRVASEFALVLAGCMTAVLWLGAFPSATFMHQWWTAAIAIPAATYTIRSVVGRVLSGGTPLVTGMATATIVAMTMATAVAARVEDIGDKAARLSATIVEPPILAGVKTDPVTASSMAQLYRAMTAYRGHHAGALIASIDEADGKSGRVAESLPLLSFLPDNPHPLPVYWRLPVLSTVVYPDYDARFAAFVASARPLLVDARRVGSGARVVPGYYLLVAAPSPAGHWFLYAPDHAERVAHGELPVTFDEPPVPQEYVTVAGAHQDEPARAYAWPATAPMTTVPWARSSSLGEIVYASPALQRPDGGLAVNGPVDAAYSYLLRVRARSFKAGDYFYAQGELEDGGLTIGLQARDRWVGSVNVDQRGRFAVMVAAPRDGEYSLVLANYVVTTWWQRLVHGGRLSNAFRIETAGWAVRGGADH